jgi:ABC-type nitrate/sulfonate/bicarbonate transport system permease component
MTALGTTGLPHWGTSTRQLPLDRNPLHRRMLTRLLVMVRVLAPFAVLVLLWQGSAMALGLSNYLYPRPALVFRTFGVLLQHGILPSYIESSMWRWLLGVVGGVALAVPVAVALSLSRTLHRTFFPIVNFFMAIVELAWIPLFVLWFGYGFEVIVLSIAYVAFFPVVAQTVRGITQIPRATIAATRTLGASRGQLVRHVLLPGALPSLVAGLRIGAGYGFRSLIGAEMIAAHSGLGYMIFQSRENQLTQRTIAGMIVIGLLWLCIDRLYLRPFERATIGRWGLAHEGAP